VSVTASWLWVPVCSVRWTMAAPPVPREAMAAYRDAVRRQPQNPAAWLRIGILYGRQTDQPKAAEAFARAEHLYREHSNMEGVAEIAYQRGMLANRVGKTDDARGSLQQSLEIAGNTESVPQQILPRSAARTDGGGHEPPLKLLSRARVQVMTLSADDQPR